MTKSYFLSNLKDAFNAMATECVATSSAVRLRLFKAFARRASFFLCVATLLCLCIDADECSPLAFFAVVVAFLTCTCEGLRCMLFAARLMDGNDNDKDA